MAGGRIRRRRRPRAWGWLATLAKPAVGVGLAGVLGLSGALGLSGVVGCSLSNTAVDECPSDAACVAAFGLGSSCADGYCSEPTACSTGYDCRTLFGGGACVAGSCRMALPTPVDASSAADCPMDWREPADLASLPLTGPNAPVVIGGVFSTGDPFDQAQSAAARLAVREINRTGGLTEGRKLGLVICDNGGPSNGADGAERESLNQIALDYLGGTLGVPAIVGPFSSSDSLTLVNHTLSRGYPVAFVSPAATSPQLSALSDRLESSDPYGLFWRTCASDQLQGEVLAGYIPATDVVGVVYIQDAYGDGLRTVFMNARTAEVQLYPFDSTTDLTALAQSVATGDPTSVLVIAVVASDTVAVLTEMAAAGLGAKQFYFTDGSKDGEQLLDPSLPQGVRDIVARALGTAPAAPSGQAFDIFDAELDAAFGIGANDTAFLANTYDAAYMVGYGLVHAGHASPAFDGRQITAGFAALSSGQSVDVGATDWLTAKDGLTTGGRTINIEGTSGHLDFDASTGEAPGPVEIWSVEPGLTGFHTEQVIYP